MTNKDANESAPLGDNKPDGPEPKVRGAGEDVERSGANLKPLGDSDGIPPVGWEAPLLDLLAAIVSRLGLVTLFVLFGVGVGVYQVLTIVPYFKASAVVLLLPREKPNLDVSVSAGSLETGMDGAKRESTGSLMLPPDPALYTTILLSQPTLMALAGKFEKRLLDVGAIAANDRSEEVWNKVRSMLLISSTDEGMMTVQVSSTDAELAADMANEFTAEMERASKAIECQLILQQSGFLGEAQKRVQAQLTSEEGALRDFFSKHGVVDMPAQAGDSLRVIREQQQSMKALEHELMERLTTYTEADGHVKTLRTRIAKHQADIELLQHSYLGRLSQQNYGAVQIEYDGLHDRVRYKRDLLATIATQRAIFDIRAEQPAGSVAVLKTAVAAARPAGPSKRLTLGIPIALSIVLSIGLVLLLGQWSKSAVDPYLLQRKAEIWGHLGQSWLGRLLSLISAPYRWLRRRSKVHVG